MSDEREQQKVDPFDVTHIDDQLGRLLSLIETQNELLVEIITAVQAVGVAVEELKGDGDGDGDEPWTPRSP